MALPDDGATMALTAQPARAFATRLRQASLLWGYGAIIALAAFSTIGVWSYDRFFDVALRGKPSFPFVIFSLGLFLAICLARPLWLVIRLHPEPLRQIARDLRTYRFWLLTSALVAVALPQTLEFSSTMKKAIPQLVPFYADHAIIRIESTILGTDAWRITHAVLGDAATRAIDLIYGLWHIANISLCCWLVLTSDRKFQVRAVLSYQLIWLLLGGLLATLLSSVGPCFLAEFTGDQRFLPLIAELRALDAQESLHSLTAMGYLLASKGTDSFGSGISAMPSLHVAVAFLSLLAIRSRTKSLAALLGATAYLLVILVGSVHLGWHYLLDGIVAIFGTWLIWLAVSRFTDRLESGNPPPFRAA